jgi:hypothetical protein
MKITCLYVWIIYMCLWDVYVVFPPKYIKEFYSIYLKKNKYIKIKMLELSH